MVPFLVSLASCDPKNNANVVPHFNYLDESNAMVALIMTLASYYKKVMLHLILIILNKGNDALDDSTSVM